MHTRARGELRVGRRLTVAQPLGEGLEQPISYPDDAGDTLLKQALGGEDAVNSMGQDDDFEEKFEMRQPALFIGNLKFPVSHDDLEQVDFWCMENEIKTQLIEQLSEMLSRY